MLTREDDGEEDEEDELSVYPKRRKTMDLYMKERRKTQCRLPKPEPNAEYQCRAVLLAMGAGEADRGKRGRQGQARPMGASEAGGGRRDRLGQARLVGAGEANGGRKPPGQIPSQHSPFGPRLSR